jgi:hypothetical protein
MNTTYKAISRNEVHICEVGPKNELGRIVQVLRDVEARTFLWQIERWYKGDATVADEVSALKAAFAQWPADGIVRVGVSVDERVAA